jgi:hypothetical protein
MSVTRLASILAGVFALALSVLPPTTAAAQPAACDCTKSTLMGDAVSVSTGGPTATATVNAGVEWPALGPLVGMAGSSPRFKVDVGANTIRIDTVQQPATYGGGMRLNFTSLNPAAPGGCTNARIGGVVVATNKPGAGYIASGITFTANSVSVPIAPTTGNIDWLPGEYIVVTLRYICDTATPTPTADACCPPWSSGQLQSMLVYQGTGGISAPYTLRFQPTAVLHTQINAYVNYITTLGMGFTNMQIKFDLLDAGTGATPFPGTQLSTSTMTWTGSGSPTANFFPAGMMQTNRWYRIRTTTILNGGPGSKWLQEKCITKYVDVRIQVQPSPMKPGAGAPASSGGQLQIRTEDGRISTRSLD